ncbi:PAS domain-containing protein [Halobaculum gomorrense]|uniref:PAS domain S-box-containing protein n=1 Tax=Halobaculum gomorrense TaxID=43928 RepID=A0A1M5UDV9_9EURY|nr:PAS domain-containing protein [Halobaculum gomorrense]SHH61245.1 PAS domain S-box-containing protein [Halobaculum gomorrense]
MARHGTDRTVGAADAAARRAEASDGPTAASTDAVDEALKTRTMDEAPVGITIADATEPDMPLVYANAAFERITGYPPSYAVGRNCRFLQGEATRERPVEQMRTAIERGGATTVEIRNYRRDGELFWNEVTIAPLYDESGAVVNYVGFQQDVTRRKRAERAAEQRAARIERERAAQRRLLQRLHGVVTDVTEAVTRSTSRTDLEREVVDRIDRTYAGAWIGRYDPRAEEIVIEAAEGSTGGEDAGRRVPLACGPTEEADGNGDRSGVGNENRNAGGSDDQEADGRVAAAVSGAMTDRFVRTESIDDSSGSGVTEVAAIPIHYGDATYGAVGVYTHTDGGFATNERAVLTAVGRAFATGVNAIETRRTFHDREGVELRFGIGDHPLTAVAAAAGCPLHYRGTVGDRDRPSMLFEASADGSGVDPDALRAAGGELATVHSVLAETADATILELSVDDDRLRRLFEEHGAELEAMTVESDRARIAVAAGREALAQSLVEAVTEAFDRTELLGYRRHTDRGRTRAEFVAAVTDDLTDRQHAALVRAVAAGYFEWPRAVDGDELAGSMGVCRSTFHQHLRAAERKLVAAFVGSEESDPLADPEIPN